MKIFQLFKSSNDEDPIIKFINEIKKDEGFPVPYKYRLYVDEEDLKNLPEGIHVYVGPRGAMYIDVRELKELKEKRRKLSNDDEEESKEEESIEGEEAYQNQTPKKPKKTHEYLEESNRLMMELKKLLEENEIEVEILDLPERVSDDEKTKWKSAYIDGKIRIFAKNIPEEEQVRIADTVRMIEQGELDKAMHTVGWYYYHSVGHLMFREYGFEDEWLDELRRLKDKTPFKDDYANIDLEEFWCQVFALHVLTDGKSEKYLGEELSQFIHEKLGIMFEKGFANRERIGGYAYDSYDIEIGVKKSKPKGLDIELKKFFELFKDDDFWFTTIVDAEDREIVKEYLPKAIQNYGEYTTKALEEGRLWFMYSGLTFEQSRKINEILKWIVKKRYWKYKEYVIRKLMKEVGIDRKKAELIAITELSYLANKARELAYKNETGVQKFVYVNEPGACEKCREVARRTRDGVTLEELKDIVREVCGNSAREYLCHPRCRCTFIRKHKKPEFMKPFEVM